MTALACAKELWGGGGGRISPENPGSWCSSVLSFTAAAPGQPYAFSIDCNALKARQPKQCHTAYD